MIKKGGKNEKKIEEERDNDKKKKRNKKIILIIILLFSLIFITFFVFSFLILVFNQAKPIIYLYPETETEISVKLGKPENITCSYPKYDKEGWKVIAKPNGELIDIGTGRNLYALYWEGQSMDVVNMKDGFVVKGEDTAKFLEEKLEILGLNERESEEFIVYWLPKLEKNKYNQIRFATIEEINEIMPLEFSIQPDTLIRVLMQYKPLKKDIEIPEQNLETPERKGFVAVEWGGSEIK